jgi:hypothetical protein
MRAIANSKPRSWWCSVLIGNDRMNCHVGFKTFVRGLAPVMLAISLMGCQTVAPTETKGLRGTYPAPQPQARVARVNAERTVSSMEQISLRNSKIGREERLRRQAMRWPNGSSGGTGLIIGIGF